MELGRKEEKGEETTHRDNGVRWKDTEGGERTGGVNEQNHWIYNSITVFMRLLAHDYRQERTHTYFICPPLSLIASYQ